MEEGWGGALVRGKRQAMWWFRDLKPSCVVLYLGSNDLANGAGADATSQALYQLACSLLSTEVKVVAVLSILPRRAGLFGSSVERFERDRLAYNTCLNSMCNGDVLFYKQKGYSQVQDWSKKLDKEVVEWSMDGIHVTTEEGWRLYRRSLKNALLMGAKRLRELQK